MEKRGSCDGCPNGDNCVCVSPVWSSNRNESHDAPVQVFISATAYGKGGLK